MKTKIKSKFERLPKDYQGLVMMFMPKAIHDEIDYDNTVEVIDVLAGNVLTDDQELYLDTLSTLLEAYEDEHHAIRVGRMSPLEALKFLMMENEMSVADLGKILGERTLGSKILRGDRKIGVTYAKMLAKRFCVDVGMFIE